MTEILSILPPILLALMIVSASGIFFLMLLDIFTQMKAFAGKSGVIVSALASVSAMAGTMLLLLRAGASEAGYAQSTGVNYSLLPPVVVAWTIILLQLLIVAITTSEHAEDKATKDQETSVAEKNEPVPGRVPGSCWGCRRRAEV